jgi:serine protease SohB
LFREFVAEHRPGLEIEGVGTGETWFGQRALERGLVDELITSDEYITGACITKVSQGG